MEDSVFTNDIDILFALHSIVYQWAYQGLYFILISCALLSENCLKLLSCIMVNQSFFFVFIIEFFILVLS